MHNGLLQLGDEKMSKSLGNLINMREAIDRYGGDAMRVFVLGSGYRSPLTYSEEAMAAGKTAAERLRNAAGDAGHGHGRAHRRRRPTASASSRRWTKTSTPPRPRPCSSTWRARSTAAATPGAPSARRRRCCESWRASWACASESQASEAMAAAPFIELLIDLRKELREAKQYALADRIRNGLGELGIALEDGAGGTTWKAK